MPVFDYLALDPNGGTVKGVMEGDAERFVRAQLRERGLVPMAVTAIPEYDAQARSDGTPRAWFRRSIGSTEPA